MPNLRECSYWLFPPPRNSFVPMVESYTALFTSKWVTLSRIHLVARPATKRGRTGIDAFKRVGKSLLTHPKDQRNITSILKDPRRFSIIYAISAGARSTSRHVEFCWLGTSQTPPPPGSVHASWCRSVFGGRRGHYGQVQGGGFGLYHFDTPCRLA